MVFMSLVEDFNADFMLFVSLVVSFIEDFKEDFNGKEEILKACSVFYQR